MKPEDDRPCGKRSSGKSLRAVLPAILSLLTVGCHSQRATEHIFNVTAGPRFNGAVVRVDDARLGLLAPPPYLDLWPLNYFWSDSRWAVLSRDISNVPLRAGGEHLLEIVPQHGPTRSLRFIVTDKKEPRFINFGFERSGALAGIVYHKDGSMTFFPGGATLR